MDEFIKALTPSLNIILGALMAMVGARFQAWFNNKNEKARLKTEKLENAYQLCQKIYDGHLREINNAKKYLPEHPSEYLKARNHPGSEMSELKMSIRAYAPELKDNLSEIDKGHAPLKKEFREIEDKVLARQDLSEEELVARYTEWDKHLKAVGNGSNIIKASIESKLRELTE